MRWRAKAVESNRRKGREWRPGEYATKVERKKERLKYYWKNWLKIFSRTIPTVEVQYECQQAKKYEI